MRDSMVLVVFHVVKIDVVTQSLVYTIIHSVSERQVERQGENARKERKEYRETVLDQDFQHTDWCNLQVADDNKQFNTFLSLVMAVSWTEIDGTFRVTLCI